MRWMNEPATWAEADGELRVTAAAGTDFWRATHYGFVRGNAHVYGADFEAGFDLSVRVRGAYAAQYDQAGAMIFADEEHWLKTGIEYYEGRPRFSTVITLGFSNWSIADLPDDTREIGLMLSRRGDAVEVHYAADGGSPQLASIVYLPPATPVLAGVMCAAPDGPGFEAVFSGFEVAAAP